MFDNLNASPARTVFYRSDFIRADAERKKAKSNIDVEVAEQAVADSERASQRAAQVLSGAQGGSPVGGGAFSRLRGRRGGLVIGGAMTGGLAAANRAKLADTKRAAVQTAYDADINAMANSGGSGRSKLARLRKNRMVA